MAHLHRNNLKHTTLQNYLSAISYHHKMASVQDTANQFIIQKFLLGVKSISPQPRRLQPITIDILTDLIQSLNKLHLSLYNHTLLKSLMLLLYWGCLRIGEIVTSANADHVIHPDQVSFERNPTTREAIAMLIKFRSYKHSKGSTPVIKIKSVADQRVCPVSALLQYLSIRPNIPSRPLFIYLLGPTVTRSFVVDYLQQALQLTKHKHLLVNSHSFRIGRTTDLVLQGKADAYIQKVGRWSSTAYHKYIRPQIITV